MKQKKISKYLGIDETLLSRLLTGKRQVSWPLAEKFSQIFPGKSISQWKRATPEELKQTFRSLDTQIQTIKETMK